MKRLLWIGLGLALANGAQARKPHPGPYVPQVVQEARAQMDWEAAGDEAVEVLRKYLMVPTINPPGDEMLGVNFLAEQLSKEEIPHQIIDHGNNRASLIGRLQGSGREAPLCLLHHIDVVPAEDDKWEHPPFGGVIQDGALWGRGALDMKGLGALQLMSLLWLKRLNIPLKRDVILIAVADEEVSNAGARHVFEEEAIWSELGCSHLINEGGLGIQDGLFEGQDVHGISVAEKGVLWVRITATGPAGHGSVEQEGEAPDTLLQVMKAIEKKRVKPKIDPLMFEMLRQVGVHKKGLIGSVLQSKALVKSLVKPKLMKQGPTRAMVTNTVHLTGTSGGQSPNVVPAEVWVQYDCRLLPGVSGEEHLALLKKWTRHIDNIAFEVVQDFPASQSPLDDELYRALAQYAVEGRPQAVAVPTLSVGFTDSLFARRRGVRAYGYVPFVLTVEEAQTMHGHNERVSLENIKDGLRVLLSAVMDFAHEHQTP